MSNAGILARGLRFKSLKLWLSLNLKWLISFFKRDPDILFYNNMNLPTYSGITGDYLTVFMIYRFFILLVKVREFPQAHSFKVIKNLFRKIINPCSAARVCFISECKNINFIPALFFSFHQIHFQSLHQVCRLTEKQ